MRRWKWSLILCVGVLVWSATANASVAVRGLENPYVSVVTNRNLFQLKLSKPLDVDEPPQPPPLRDIRVSGITTLPDATRAIVRVMSAAKPPEPAKEISLFLTPGGPAEDGVQVLDIDVRHGLVKISNAGTLQILDITKNAPKAAAAPSPPAVLPVPPPRGGVMAVPPPGTPPIPSNEEQTWTMALQREQDLKRISTGQIRAEDLPPYPPNEVTAEADREAMDGNK